MPFSEPLARNDRRKSENNNQVSSNLKKADDYNRKNRATSQTVDAMSCDLRLASILPFNAIQCNVIESREAELVEVRLAWID